MAGGRTERFPLGAAASLDQLAGDPHPLLARLRAGEPVSRLPALGGWLVTRRDLALRVMREPETFTVEDARFSTGRVIGPSMLTVEGAEHERHRAPFARPFRLGEVRERFSGPVERTADRLIDAFEHEGAVELRGEFAGPLAAAVVKHALGLEGTEPAALLGWYRAIVEAVTEVTAGRPVTAEGRGAYSRLAEAIEAVLDREQSGSLVAAAARRATGLERREVVSNAGVLLFGGIETTEGMIANAVLHLLANPDQLDLVRADHALLPGAIEESLRLEPAAAMVDRYATKDTELGGAAIAAGDLVTVSVTAANRDPAVFEDPDRFDVRRPNAGRHVAFAHGPHVCIGMHLARLEAHTGVRRLLERLSRLRLDPSHDPAARGLVFRKPPALRVVWG